MTPEEIAKLAKKEAEDKAKTEAQKKVDAIAAEKTRSVTEDGTDLTAPIKVNTDGAILNWGIDTLKYTAWNVFIGYLKSRSGDLDARINTGEYKFKTQEFINDFNNNYIYKKSIGVIVRKQGPTKTDSKGKIDPGPFYRDGEQIILDTFKWSERYGPITTQDVYTAQEFHAITNPIGSVADDGRKNEVKIDGRIGTQTLQMLYPYRGILYQVEKDEKLYEDIEDSINNGLAYGIGDYGKPYKSYGIPGHKYTKRDLKNYLEFPKLVPGKDYEELGFPTDAPPNTFYRFFYGNRRYVVSTEYVNGIVNSRKKTDYEEFLWEYGNALPLAFPDKSKWILYTTEYADKLFPKVSDFGPRWGNPTLENPSTKDNTVPKITPESANKAIAKNKIDKSKLKVETQLKTKITGALKK
jgi:hypothetical protein